MNALTGEVIRDICGAEIPLGARIFSVVDSLDAMTWTVRIIEAKSRRKRDVKSCRNSGTQFDPSSGGPF